MKYDVEMGSVANVYMPNFVKNGSGLQKLIGGYIYMHTYRKVLS
jgi:hypothetical protein